MFKRFKKLFAKEKPTPIKEIEIAQLHDWLGEEIAQLSFHEYVKSYYLKSYEIKNQLQEKVEVLSNQEIDKKHKTVDARIQNVVTGHRDRYVADMQQFIERSFVDEKSDPHYKQTIIFNQNLDEALEKIAKKTNKSYQATQHLFFEPVQDVFKLMSELNNVVANCKEEIKKRGLEKIEKIENSISDLHNQIKKGKEFAREVEQKRDGIAVLQKNLEEEKKKQVDLENSDQYKELLELKNTLGKEEEEYKEIENQIFSFFSKLSKPLKKYRRVALDDKLIAKYIENSVGAFWADSSLDIVNVLGGLAKNLEKFSFDQKQQKKFGDLIEKAQEGYLKELREKGSKIKEKRNALRKEIDQNTTEDQIKEVARQIGSKKNNLEIQQNEISELQEKLERTDLEKTQNQIIFLAKEVFNVELKIV